MRERWEEGLREDQKVVRQEVMQAGAGGDRQQHVADLTQQIDSGFGGCRLGLWPTQSTNPPTLL